MYTYFKVYTMIELTILIVSAFIIFVLGMLVQKFCISSVRDNIVPHKSFLTQSSESNKQNIVLDDTKVVLKIDTSKLEKTVPIEGKTLVTENDTLDAINKLKNIKKGK